MAHVIFFLDGPGLGHACPFTHASLDLALSRSSDLFLKGGITVTEREHGCGNVGEREMEEGEACRKHQGERVTEPGLKHLFSCVFANLHLACYPATSLVFF